jgi:hypothetical protein
MKDGQRGRVGFSEERGSTSTGGGGADCSTLVLDARQPVLDARQEERRSCPQDVLLSRRNDGTETRATMSRRWQVVRSGKHTAAEEGRDGGGFFFSFVERSEH